MRKTFSWVIGLAVAICLLFAGWWLFSTKSGRPKLVLTYLGQTNQSGRPLALFAVTNQGDGVAINYHTSGIEIASPKTFLMVASVAQQHRLLPGEGDIIKVFIPRTGLATRWRFKSWYTHEGIRSKIYDWQWGTNGPGARVNRLIPKALKGVPLDTFALSEWIVGNQTN